MFTRPGIPKKNATPQSRQVMIPCQRPSYAAQMLQHVWRCDHDDYLGPLVRRGKYMVSINGATPIAGWFIMFFLVKWMSTRGTLILGNPHVKRCGWGDATRKVDHSSKQQNGAGDIAGIIVGGSAVFDYRVLPSGTLW